MRDVDPSDSQPAYRLIFADLKGRRYTEDVRSWLMFLWARKDAESPWVWVACGRSDEMADLQSRLKCSSSVIVPWDVDDGKLAVDVEDHFQPVRQLVFLELQLRNL